MATGVLLQRPEKGRNQEPPECKAEEWEAGYPRSLPHLRDKSIPDWQKLK
jgi:hypothetical protein